MIGPFANESRGARERGTVAALEEAGVKVVKIDSPPEWAADPNLAIPVITAAILNNPDVKAVGYPGGQMLGNVPTYMQAAGKKGGRHLQLRLRHQPADRRGLQGRLGAADSRPAALPAGLSADPVSLCQQVVLGLAPMNVDTGAGFVTPENYEIVAELAKQALR